MFGGAFPVACLLLFFSMREVGGLWRGESQLACAMVRYEMRTRTIVMPPVRPVFYLTTIIFFAALLCGCGAGFAASREKEGHLLLEPSNYRPQFDPNAVTVGNISSVEVDSSNILSWCADVALAAAVISPSASAISSFFDQPPRKEQLAVAVGFAIVDPTFRARMAAGVVVGPKRSLMNDNLICLAADFERAHEQLASVASWPQAAGGVLRASALTGDILAPTGGQLIVPQPALRMDGVFGHLAWNGDIRAKLETLVCSMNKTGGGCFAAEDVLFVHVTHEALSGFYWTLRTFGFISIALQLVIVGGAILIIPQTKTFKASFYGNEDTVGAPRDAQHNMVLVPHGLHTGFNGFCNEPGMSSGVGKMAGFPIDIASSANAPLMHNRDDASSSAVELGGSNAPGGVRKRPEHTESTPDPTAQAFAVGV